MNLQTGGSLRLLLHDERGAAIGGATIVLRKAGQGPTDPQQSNNFEGQDWALLASQQDNLAVVTADGSGEAFFTHLPPGRYNATYSLPYYTSGQKTDIEVNTGENDRN